jgi:type I restriction enzyme S subunit
MTIVPPGWAMVHIADLVADESGALTDGPFGSNLKSSHYTTQGPRVIRLQNIGDCVFLDERAHISQAHFDSLSRHEARSGDVVVAMLGEQLPRACVVPGAVGPAIVKADCVRLRVHPQLAAAAFVAAGLNSDRMRRQATELMHGVGRPRLGLRWFKTLRFPLAPEPEQRRIVEAIESYFTRLDDAVASLERVQRNLKRHRASVLKAAVEGRLVPTEAELARAEGRAYEPARLFVGAVEPPPRPQRYASRSSDVVLGHAALAIGNPRTSLPEGWVWAPLLDIARLESGHTPSRRHPEWWGGDIPWIGIPDARDHHGGTIHDTLQHTNEAGLANSAARLLPAGTVCLSRTASIGYVVMTGRPMATSQDFVNWICTNAVNPEWLRVVLMADRQALLRFGKGSVHRTIYYPEVLSFHVALPSLAEQKRIVAAVDRHELVAHKTSQTVALALNRARRLRRGILRWAFEGKLADQDPNDEPAAVLLERIKAERFASAESATTDSHARRKRGAA